MSKTTTFPSLAGRVIEKVSLFHADGNENPMCLEIRCGGGHLFLLELVVEARLTGIATLANDRNGQMENKRTKRFYSEGTMPYASPEEE